RVLELVGLSVSPHVIASLLSIGQRQLVEIAKALSANARLLVMDEPTSSLTQPEAERLFRLIRELRSREVSIIYISHRLGEIRQIADRAVVLRDGRVAGELQQEQLSHEALVRLMVGRDLSQFYSRTSHPLGETACEVRDLRTTAFPREKVSF